MSDLAFDTASNKWLPIDDASALIYQPAPAGTVARPYVAKFAEQISMLDFVPYTTATDVDMPAGAALDISNYLMGSGRKCLYIPARKFIFHEGAAVPTGAFYAIAAPGASDITVIGEGRGKSIIYIANGVNVGVLAFGGSWPSQPFCYNIALQGFTLDGNRINNLGVPGVHGIRFGGYHEHLYVADLEVKNAVGYGLGFQEINSGANGYYKHVKVSNVYVENSGNDGIDFKDAETLNEDIQLNNISVYGFNAHLSTGEYTGIDIRGQAQLNNIRVKGTPGAKDNSGIRFRYADGGGSRTSGVSNFWVELETSYVANLAADVLTVGVDMETGDCYAVNGYIKTCDRGVSVPIYDNCKVAHVIAEGCGQGFASLSAKGLFEDCTAFGSTVADTSAAVGTRFAHCRFAGVPTPVDGSAARPAVEVVAATASTGGVSGLIRNATGDLSIYNGASEIWRFNAAINAFTGYPSATFTALGTLMLPAGANSRPALSVRAVDTNAQNVLSFETPSGVLITVNMNNQFMNFRDSAAANLITMSLGKIGFLGSTGAARPTVTGAKGGNAALASLLTGLAALGLITDTTTA